MTISRRSIFAAIPLLLAPAIVRASSLMPVSASSLMPVSAPKLPAIDLSTIEGRIVVFANGTATVLRQGVTLGEAFDFAHADRRYDGMFLRGMVDAPADPRRAELVENCVFRRLK